MYTIILPNARKHMYRHTVIDVTIYLFLLWPSLRDKLPTKMNKMSQHKQYLSVAVKNKPILTTKLLQLLL